MVELINVSRIYKNKSIKEQVLSNISLKINEGEIIVIVGKSGSGKTTLLNIISLLDKKISGKILYNGKNISKYSNYFRKKNIGYIFQSYNLLENLNVYENIKVGMHFSRNKVDVMSIIKILHLENKVKNKIYELSGGEKQRVAIGRSLVKCPRILLMDEPTGALDEKNGKEVLKTIIDINEKFKTTIVMVTHNPNIILIGDRVINMNNGEIINCYSNLNRIDPFDIEW